MILDPGSAATSTSARFDLLAMQLFYPIPLHKSSCPVSIQLLISLIQLFSSHISRFIPAFPFILTRDNPHVLIQRPHFNVYLRREDDTF